jgi:DNA-binding NarL/FixJ family response regulator
MHESELTPVGKTKQILIIENHPIVAEATKLCLSRIDPTLVTTVCGSAEAALVAFHAKGSWFRIFLDPQVQGSYGLSLLRQFARLGVAEKCVVMAGTDNLQWKAEAAAMGILGYLNKASPLEDFTTSIEAVIQGRRVFSTDTLSHEEAVPVRLTRRQQDVLYLLHRGYSSKRIAGQLSLSTGTVDNHVTAILRAFNVTNRTHAIARAIALGFVSLQNASMHGALQSSAVPVNVRHLGYPSWDDRQVSFC